MAAIIGFLLEDKAISTHLFVPLRGRFVCLNSSQKRHSPRNAGDDPWPAPGRRREERCALLDGKSKIIIMWEQERSPAEAQQHSQPEGPTVTPDLA